MPGWEGRVKKVASRSADRQAIRLRPNYCWVVYAGRQSIEAASSEGAPRIAMILTQKGCLSSSIGCRSHASACAALGNTGRVPIGPQRCFHAYQWLLSFPLERKGSDTCQAASLLSDGGDFKREGVQLLA